MCSTGEEQKCVPPDWGFSRIVTLHKDKTYTPSKILRGLVGPMPLTLLNCWSSHAASQLQDTLASNRFDTVQIEGVHLLAYLPILRSAPGCPAILVDWHNIESDVMWRYARTTPSWAKKAVAQRTARLIYRAEDRLLEACTTHTVTSERERQKLLSRCPGAKIKVIPNGTDTDSYAVEKLPEVSRGTDRARSKQTILFVGSMDYHANIDAVAWFAREVWPEIACNHPDIDFTIVGRDPAPEVRALASDRIHVTGTVDDLRPYYTSALAVVVPLRYGGGTRLKILEAMAARVPVLSTRLGAEGIDADDDVHLLLADTSQELTAAVSRLVASPELRVRLSQAARLLVSKFYGWSTIGKQLYEIHAELMQSRTASSAPERF